MQNYDDRDKALISESILRWLKEIYKDEWSDELSALTARISTRLTTGAERVNPNLEKWDQGTCVLISYADSVTEEGLSPIVSLGRFCDTYLHGVVSTIHILPFFPSSGDDGFAVSDHERVDASLGAWADVTSLSKKYRVMADLVLNHGAQSSPLFQQFLNDEEPGNGFFLTVNEDFDVSRVIRPRGHPLLLTVTTKSAERVVWCTFSEDQVDYDFTNPAVLEYFLNIILDFINHGVSVLRLDAVGFLWKRSGTTCLNLSQTHAIIKLIRYICDAYADDVVIVTETNLPNQENLSYFGNGNEAHWIYNFPLPPLLLHTLLTGDSNVLRRWAMSMPPALLGNSYLNFLASHDGFGLRPTEGLLDDDARENLVQRLEQNGSLFTWRTMQDGTKKIYEANITLYSALEKTDVDPNGRYAMQRFIAAHLVMFSLEGVPALYINSLLATENDLDEVSTSGINRRINRKKHTKAFIDSRLSSTHTRERILFDTLKTLIKMRAAQAAFHPNATQFTLQLGRDYFGVWRQSQDRGQSVFAITNLTSTAKRLQLADLNLIEIESWRDLIGGARLLSHQSEMGLDPYQTVWITNK
ncbi:MAG: alpha-amylase family glycosyl hydrolase [Burkholderiales bacterium]|jgi:sucrose phosphorylase|tara:strand:- start:7750 stop:9501 length:1752 start_codon:yes stop_codon:yes gene_type:complete